MRSLSLPACLLVLAACVQGRAEGPAPVPTAPPAEDRDETPDAAQHKQRLRRPDLLDDVPELFEPVHPRSDAETERLEALSLFAAARVKEQHEDFAGALRLYQRALRHDPRSPAILRQIVSLAQELHRSAELVRYYTLLVELDPSDANALRQLGDVLGRQGQYERALKLYDQARALHAEKRSAGYMILTLEAGKLRFQAKQFAQAADCFAEVLQALEHPDDFGIDEGLKRDLFGNPGPAPTYELFAETFLLADRPDDAVAAFERANAAAPNAAVHAFHLAQVDDRRGRPAEALEQLQIYLNAHEGSQEAAPYELLAKVLADLDRKAEVLPMLEAARAADSKNAPLRLFLAGLYVQSDMPERAEPLYREAAAENPSPTAYRALAAIYRKSRRPAELLKVLGECAGYAQRFLSQRSMEGKWLKTIWLEVLGDEAKPLSGDADLLTAVLAAARQAHQASADNLGYDERVAAGLLALEAGRLDDAGEFLALAKKIQKRHADELYQTWAMSLLSSEEYDAAAKLLRQALDELGAAATGPELYSLLSIALEFSDHNAEALAAAKTAIGRAAHADPGTRARLESRIPWILFHAKQYSDASAAYKDFIERFDGERYSDDVREQLQRARLALSNLCVIEHDLAQAEEWLEQVLDEEPENIAAQNDLGYLWADQGKHLEAALEMGRRAVAAEPSNAAYRDTLGWALYKLGHFEEAVAELRKAADVNAPDGTILDHLGDALWSAGQLAEARAAWQRALASLKDQGEAEQRKAVERKLAEHPEPER